mgnify:FL=1
MDFTTNHLCKSKELLLVTLIEKNVYTARRSSKCDCVVGVLCASKSRHLSTGFVEMLCKQLFALGCGLHMVIAESTRSSLAHKISLIN